ncbi:MAG: oxidoreductase-like protein, partial [Solirubrobacterales bacterium]|nr:oxidoreductase-like protein [Solirubrobacterales bacterium]
MIRVGVVGLGKMGLSHHALLHAHPDVEVVGVCDSASYVLGVLKKNTGVETYDDYGQLLEEAKPEAVVIATPSRLHVEMVRMALKRDIHVFCEKPLTLGAADADLLAGLAAERGLVTQVGYHNRFVAAFQEVKRLLDAGAIGEVTHVMGEAYGPVVLKPKGRTWRSRQSEGGGCLFDYAAHVINLVHWYMGEPVGVGGTVLPRIFSSETDDGALSTLYFEDGKTGQISVDWSDESYRKMTT